MTLEKLWKYKYRDEVEESDPYFDEGLNTDVTDIRAKHHPGWNAPVLYDVEDGSTCYIYSDEEIAGLELVDENVRFRE